MSTETIDRRGCFLDDTNFPLYVNGVTVVIERSYSVNALKGVEYWRSR